jgi:hypothetical protein
MHPVVTHCGVWEVSESVIDGDTGDRTADFALM